VLCVVDAVAVVAECKAGGFSSKSAKGKPRPLKEDIKELVREPSRQARRLAEILEGATGNITVKDPSGKKHLVDAKGISKSIRLSVTLSPIGSILPRLADLVEGGLSDEEL